MFFQAVTLFPEMFAAITGHGVSGRALQQGLWRFEAVNPRRFADNRLGYIDDRPFGGGPGMIMMLHISKKGPIQTFISVLKGLLSKHINTF